MRSKGEPVTVRRVGGEEVVRGECGLSGEEPLVWSHKNRAAAFTQSCPAVSGFVWLFS